MRRGLSVINISEVAVKIGTDIFAQILHLSQCLDVNIQTILHTVCCRKDFLFTMGIDAFFAVCLWRFAQFCQEIGQVLFDGFGISECSRINGNKTMACAALAVLDTVVGCQTHRKDGAEDFAEHGITITFVAACQFFCAGPEA